MKVNLSMNNNSKCGGCHLVTGELQMQVTYLSQHSIYSQWHNTFYCILVAANNHLLFISEDDTYLQT